MFGNEQVSRWDKSVQKEGEQKDRCENFRECERARSSTSCGHAHGDRWRPASTSPRGTSSRDKALLTALLLSAEVPLAGGQRTWRASVMCTQAAAGSASEAVAQRESRSLNPQID